MERSTRDRWFTWPWRPWVKTRMYVPQLPDPHLYKIEDEFDGQLLMGHPETLHDLGEIVDARQ